jgi:hypothetical protein
LLALTLVVASVAFAQTEEKDCTGSCIFSNGVCRSVDCGGTNCGCSGGRNDCACQ